jgi:preprotein translocase subunit SecE
MNWWKRTTDFLGEVKIELKKVTWPTKPEVVGTTGVVLVIVVIFSVFLYGADLVFGKIVTQLLKIQ